MEVSSMNESWGANNVWGLSERDIEIFIEILDRQARQLNAYYRSERHDELKGSQDMRAIIKFLSPGGYLESALAAVEDQRYHRTFREDLSSHLMKMREYVGRFIAETGRSTVLRRNLRRRGAAPSWAPELIFDLCDKVGPHRIKIETLLAERALFIEPTPISLSRRSWLSELAVLWHVSVLGAGFGSPTILLLLIPLGKASQLMKLPCVRLVLTMTGFIGLSCFLGLYFTIHKQYGYTMSDSFTLASYVVAVGAFICSFLFALHFRKCECWKTHDSSGAGDEGGAPDNEASAIELRRLPSTNAARALDIDVHMV